jgi:thioredoxin-like negative regulator of GroEL
MTIATTTSSTYQADVLDAPGLVLVGFVLTGEEATVTEICLQKMVEAFTGNVTAFKVDSTAEEQLLIDTGVNQVPTILAYKNGVKVHTLRGLQTVSQVERCVQFYM